MLNALFCIFSIRRRYKGERDVQLNSISMRNLLLVFKGEWGSEPVGG